MIRSLKRAGASNWVAHQGPGRWIPLPGPVTSVAARLRRHGQSAALTITAIIWLCCSFTVAPVAAK
ncbi:hypothetical protein BX265_1139 [Streptomyces sp. TLI_235]|nr:hypothetical protein BX265_1139 [Streptomyces sp. TLI_235]